MREHQKDSAEWFEPGRFEICRGRATIYEWSSELAGVLKESRATQIDIREWPYHDLGPLIEFRDQIVSLGVGDSVPDLSAVPRLLHLRELGLSAGADTIDWSQVRSIEQLSLSTEAPNFGNLAACPSLKRLHVTASSLRDLRPLAGLPKLEELLVYEAPLASLRGIEEIPSLRRLVIQQVPLKSLEGLERAESLSAFVVEMASRLESVAELAGLPALRSVRVGASRRIADLERLGEARRLEQLEIERRPLRSAEFIAQLTGLRRLRVESVGKLPSLEFLRPLEVLEVFEAAGSTTIVDGDVSILLELPMLREVFFADRRHYSHRCEEIMQVLLSRRTWGPGAFENERALRWTEQLDTLTDPWDPLRAVRATVASIMNVSAPGLKGGGEQLVPAWVGQVGVAAAELVAWLLGRRGGRSGEAPAVEAWIRVHGPVGVPEEAVEQAVQALDRVIRPPSGLLDLWEKRGKVPAWVDAVAELRDRLTR